MKKVFIIALLPLFAFGLPHREGQVLEVEEEQANELIEAGYAKLAEETEAEKVESTGAEKVDLESIEVKAEIVEATEAPKPKK